MQIDRKGDNSAVVRPGERIDITNSDDFKENLLSLFDEGYNDITIDFRDVTGIDSSGLGKLLLFQKKLKERDGKLSIVNVNNDYVKKMFKMIHLSKVIDIEGID